MYGVFISAIVHMAVHLLMRANPLVHTRRTLQLMSACRRRIPVQNMLMWSEAGTAIAWRLPARVPGAG